MADVELVIKIPEEIYDYIHNEHIAMRVCDGHKVVKAIANGTPLPKGHGRLIDADAMWNIYHSNDYDFYEAINDAPTIIEADEADRE